MNKDFVASFEILFEVYSNGAYLNIALNKLDSRDITPILTKIVYGVLERDIELEYYISKLIKSTPNRIAKIVLKLGLYSLIYLDSIPDYAVVNECVELIAYVEGNTYHKGFINATLNNFINTENIPLPKEKFARLSVQFSKPEWLVRAYYKQFGESKADDILGYFVADGEEHMRLNYDRIDDDEFHEFMLSFNQSYTKSNYGGYYLRNSREVRGMIGRGEVTIQSPSSMITVKVMGDCREMNVLDSCAAPGGKAIYLAQMYPTCQVTAGDIHPHRVELISKYAKHMGVENVVAVQNDASEFCPNMRSKFDVVLCDVPCSGLGVVHKKPDILLNITMKDVNALAEIQYKILTNCLNYCKVGGTIVYSTCTMLREENYNNIGRLLKESDQVELVPLGIEDGEKGFLQLFPSQELDGFFIAKLKKIKEKND